MLCASIGVSREIKRRTRIGALVAHAYLPRVRMVYADARFANSRKPVRRF